MDVLTNGEASGESLSNTKKDLEMESPEPDVVKAFKKNSDSTKSGKECLTEDNISLKSSSESKLNTESNIESPSMVKSLTDETTASKENGVSDSEKPISESEVKSSSSTDVIDRGESQQELEINSSEKSENVEIVPSENETISSVKESTSKENNMNAPSPSSSVTADKENCYEEANKESSTLPPSSEAKDTNDCPSSSQKDTTSPSSITAEEEKECLEVDQAEMKPTLPVTEEAMDCSVDHKDSKNTSLSNKDTDDSPSPTDSAHELDLSLKGKGEVKEKLESSSLAKNHFMAGGSIVSSEDDQANKRNSNSNHSSDVLDGNQIMDFSNKIMENSNEDSDEPMECDEEPQDFVMKKKSRKSLEDKSVESSPSSLESDKFVDSALKKHLQENSTNGTNSHKKLKEHLESDSVNELSDVSNHSEKNVPSPSITSETQSSDSHLVCDKENKCVESAPLQERLSKESPDTFVFADLSNEETGFPDAFTGLVKIGKYISVKGDFTLRSSEALVESPSLVAPYLLKEPDSFPPKDKDSKSDMKDFFHSAAGEILIGIGLSRVNEWFHKDMVRIKKRQLKRKKTPELEEDLAMHENFYSEAKKANNVYSFDFRVCKTCGFTTESSVVMEGHLLVPHITQRREYQCNYCEVIKRDPKEMLEHMKEDHQKIGRIQPPVLFFECIYCAFESNSKVKLNHHLVKCQRVYDQGINQAPGRDFEYPALTPKPITVAVVKAYEKSLGSMQKGRGRPKKDLSESMQHMNQFTPIAPHMPPYRGSSNSPLADSLMQNQMMSGMLRNAQHAGSMSQLRPGMHMAAANRFFGVINPAGQIMPMMGNNQLVNSQFPFSSNADSSGSKKSSSSSSQFYNKVFDVGQRQQNPAKGMPSVTITPLPKLTGPYPVPMAKPSSSQPNQNNSNSLVVCEICDGYIKDLEQLRTHMQLIHKVKIHPKMLVSRPPLNCQKCQWRFFTDQGLERHLLGAHGLVTSNMQELANKGKDAGCCTICGRVYASKLVTHMNQVHKITLKPAHLSYKCTVCSATFNLYRLFENHVYLVHSGAGKRSSADGNSTPSSKKQKSDAPASEEATNHKEKRSSKDVGDENTKKCKECGGDVGKSSKSKNDMCEKCLKSDELVEGTVSAKTIKDELKQKDKAIEKAAV